MSRARGPKGQAGFIHISAIVESEMSRLFRLRHNEADAVRARDNACVREYEPSKTQQSMTEDCDLNVMVKRFGIDKEPIPPAVFDPSYYGELPDGLDLREALERVREATARFNQLPVKIRNMFQNSPAMLWEFVNDPANADEAVALGLLQRSSPPAPSGPPASGSSPGEASRPREGAST